MARRIVVEVIGDSRSVERMFGRAAKSATVFNARVSRGFAGIASGAGLGAIGIGAITLGLKNAVSAAAQFEHSMQKVAGLSGVAQSKIAGLSAEVLQLAPRVGKGPQELAEALFFITSSGIDASRALGVLSASAKASAAGLGDTRTVADAVTSAMNAYGPAVVNAKTATDVLVATVREGKGEASEFAGVIGNVTAIASQLGVSFNDVGAALAAMTRLGTDAETSATQLQQVFSNLVKVTPQQAKAFEAVGLSAAGLRKTLSEQGLLAGLKQIRTAFKGDLPGLAKAFSDIRALRGVLALVGKQSEQVNGIFGRMADSSKALQIAFAAVADTSLQKFNKFNAAIEVTRISIGAALAPAVEKAAEAITVWLSKTENQERLQRQVTSAVKAAVEVVRGFVSAMRSLRDILEPVVGALGGMKNTVKLLMAVFVATKILAFSRAITGLGVQALASTGRVTALRGAMLRLGALGAITLGVEVLLNKEAISEKVDGFLRKNHLAFLTGKQIKLGADVDANKLQKVRNQLAGLKGESNLMVKALDKAIARLREMEGVSAGKVRDKIVTGLAKSETFGITKLPKPKPVVRKPVVRKPAAAEDDEPDRRRAGITATQQNQFFDSALSRTLDRAQDGNLKAQLAKLQQIAATITARIAATKDITRKLNLEDKLLDVRRQTAGLRDQLAQGFLDSLAFNVDKAAGNFARQLAALKALEKGLRARLRADKTNLDLQRQILAVTDQQADVRKQARDARQFKQLGLGADGGEVIPLKAGLARQLKQVSSQVAGTFLDTSKTSKVLAAIRKLVLSPFTKVSAEVRSTVKGMLDDLNQQLKDNAGGPLTKTHQLNADKLTAGVTGLDRDQLRRIRANASQFNSAGVGLAARPGTRGAFGMALAGGGPTAMPPIIINLDGQKISQNGRRHNTVHARSNPRQKRGGRF